MGFLIFIHVIVCLILVGIILMQSGRGGGLTEGFAAAESLFGAKTNSFMTKSTTILALVFMVTSVSLAYLTAQNSKSLMPDEVVKEDVVKEGVVVPDDAVQEVISNVILNKEE